MPSSYFSLFVQDARSIYLNSGSSSKCPLEVLEAVQARKLLQEKNPTVALFERPLIWQAQQALAEFLGANAHDLFFRPNITLALHVFLYGIPLPAGSEILAGGLEYGATVNIARERAATDGLSFRSFPFSYPAGWNGSQYADFILAQLRPNTSLLILSHVTTGTGHLFPMEKIARETRRRGILLCVDGAHAAGAVPLDFSALGDVDFYGGNLHKWLMGPKGTGFGWLNPLWREKIKLFQGGWASFGTPWFYEGFGEGDPVTARLLQAGTWDATPFMELPRLLAFWKKYGVDAIRARIFGLQAQLEKLVDDRLAWEKISPARDTRGPLLTYRLPERLRSDGKLQFRLWEEHRLQVATPAVQGEVVLRLSPHIYNEEEELARAVEILEQL